MTQSPVGVFTPMPDPMDFRAALMNIMPPLKKRPNEFLNPQFPLQVPPAPAPQSPQQTQQKLDHKERNRLAAQKWRAKKDQSLSTLEDENDHLRKTVFDLQSQALQLSVENKILESELQYFQQFMSKIMSVAPRAQK